MVNYSIEHASTVQTVTAAISKPQNKNPHYPQFSSKSTTLAIIDLAEDSVRNDRYRYLLKDQRKTDKDRMKWFKDRKDINHL